MSERIAKQIYNKILAANKVLVIPHQNPDGDTLGSVLAMIHFLERIGKPYASFCATPVSERMLFLPGIEKLSFDPDIFKDPDIDVIAVFDAGDLRYAGVFEHVEALPKKPFIVNIDHHPTNEHYGDHNLVLSKAPSTTAILYHFFSINGIHIDPAMASCLLTGLVTDTGNFTNAATTPTALKIGSELIIRGGNLKQINAHTLKDRSVDGLKLWGMVLQRLEHHAELDIVFTFVTQEDILKHDVREAEIEGIANFLNNLEDGRAGLVLKEQQDGMIKGSFRTTRDTIDVAQFARALGGGGHQKAAGFTVPGPIEHAINHVFDTIQKIENKQVE
jgi:phosphoesterase RecJ-like protein